MKKSESFTGQDTFQYEWAKFSGNERALDSKSKKLISKTEKRSPVEEEMIFNALKDLSHSLSTTLNDYEK